MIANTAAMLAAVNRYAWNANSGVNALAAITSDNIAKAAKARAEPPSPIDMIFLGWVAVVMRSCPFCIGRVWPSTVSAVAPLLFLIQVKQSCCRCGPRGPQNDQRGRQLSDLS